MPVIGARRCTYAVPSDPCGSLTSDPLYLEQLLLLMQLELLIWTINITLLGSLAEFGTESRTAA